jgi:hypothetical protein
VLYHFSHDQWIADDESKNFWVTARSSFVHDPAMIEACKLHKSRRTERRLNHVLHFRFCFGHGHILLEFFDVWMLDSGVELRQHILEGFARNNGYAFNIDSFR